MGEVTVKELEDLVLAIKIFKQNIKIKEEEVEELKAKKAEFEIQMLAHLDALEKTSYDSQHGKISVHHEDYVSMPSEPADKKAFLEYLRKREVFDSFVTVHNRTLNSFYKSEKEMAKEEANKRGEPLVDFKIPGLPEPFEKRTITLRVK